MSKDSVWPIVHAERAALVVDLANLTEVQWRTPSLCPGWDIHDVLAHLIDSAKTTRWGFVRRLLAARFDFDRDNAAGVEREKREAPTATLREFAAVQNLTSTPPAALATRLVEAFLHGEDIRRPLGIERAYPVEPVMTALRYQLATSTNMGGGKQRAQGLRLTPTDAEGELGTGATVSGTAAALLLAVSGRPVKPGELTGGGAARFSVS